MKEIVNEITPYLYYITYHGKKVYYEYRWSYALDWFLHNKCDRMYMYTKELFPKKALVMWK